MPPLGPPREPDRVAGSAPPADVAGVIAFPPLIYAAGFALGLLLQWPAPLREPPRMRALAHGLGIALSALAAVQALAARAAMRRAGTELNPMKPTTTLVRTGPFRYTRNPLYLSLTGLYIGVALWIDALWPLLVLPGVLLVAVRGVIRREEAYLERKFGEAYRAYRASVRRWL